MRILDKNDTEIFEPDLAKGYTVQDKLLIAHHDAIPAQPAKMHNEISAQYENGGETWITVIDSPAVPEKPAWDEYEDIQRYIEYTQDQLDELNQPSEIEDLKKQVAKLQADNAAMENAYRNGVNAVE